MWVEAKEAFCRPNVVQGAPKTRLCIKVLEQHRLRTSETRGPSDNLTAIATNAGHSFIHVLMKLKYQGCEEIVPQKRWLKPTCHPSPASSLCESERPDRVTSQVRNEAKMAPAIASRLLLKAEGRQQNTRWHVPGMWCCHKTLGAQGSDMKSQH